MRNGYFQLVSDSDGYGVALHQPDGGEDIQFGELTSYLDSLGIAYDMQMLETRLIGAEDCVCHLGPGECPVCPESYRLIVSEDAMAAYVRFIPPSSTGNRMSFDAFREDLKNRSVIYGVDLDKLTDHFNSSGCYCTDLLIAQGDEPIEGYDARLEYCFDTDMHRRPKLREDGSVDFFHLTTINQCRKGDVLARIIPEMPGVDGHDVFGQVLRPRPVKKQHLKYSRNIEISEDKLVLTAMVDGHVGLVDDKVSLSEVYIVKGVDVATGNIDYEGSVQVDGDVTENFEVKAGGNVVVNGLVEGARIIAGGNIIVSKGMNGMQKGYLKAGGDIVIKFLENTKVVAGGYVEAEAIMHSRVSAGTEIRVEGKRGVIVGGYVQAGLKVVARTIGAGMGAPTIIEVGVNPLVKTQYNRMQKELEELTKTIDDGQVIVDNYIENLNNGFVYSESQQKYIKSVVKMVEERTAELSQLNFRMARLRSMMEVQRLAEVVINSELHASVTIIIGDAMKTLQSDYHYCKFVRERGEVTLKPI